jgi:hypothetical protein
MELEVNELLSLFFLVTLGLSNNIDKLCNMMIKTKIIKLFIFLGNKDIREVRRRQHQYPEFGHTQGEIFKKPANKYISI